MKVALGLGTALASYLIFKDIVDEKKGFNKNSTSQREGESIFLLEQPPEHPVARSVSNFLNFFFVALFNSCPTVHTNIVNFVL